MSAPEHEFWTGGLEWEHVFGSSFPRPLATELRVFPVDTPIVRWLLAYCEARGESTQRFHTACPHYYWLPRETILSIIDIETQQQDDDDDDVVMVDDDGDEVPQATASPVDPISDEGCAVQ